MKRKDMFDINNNGVWITPRFSKDFIEFAQIDSSDGFNRIISNPSNWSKILDNKNLLDNWIVPNAVILFGKSWFDRVKWKKYMCSGIPFSLFTYEERKHILNSGEKFEQTPFGRSVIAKIIMKVSYAMRIYLEGKWYSGKNIKNPGGYIIDSIKNEMVREIGNGLGFKSKIVPACPYCLSKNNNDKKSILTYHGSRSYSCSRCEEIYNNISLQKKENKSLQELSRLSIFKRFFGVTCVCPSNNCTGHFVPLSSVDVDSKFWYKLDKKLFKKRIESIRNENRSYFIPRNIYSFVDPPEEMKDLPLLCPYCNTKFSPRLALNKRSGFKEKSGKFTGLPTVSIWDKRDEIILDYDVKDNNKNSYKDNLAMKRVEVDTHIISQQKIGVIIGEIAIHMAKVNKEIVSGLLTWYFYMAAIKWTQEYWEDSVSYFFDYSVKNRKVTKKEKEIYGRDLKVDTNVVRGKDVAIHQSLFHMWINLLNQNIDEFNRIDPNICNLSDFSLFCSPPKFSGGPISTFSSTVDIKKCIKNNTNITCIKSQRFKPRIAKVLSIQKYVGETLEDYNYVCDINYSEWQLIRLNIDSNLSCGDNVLVTALMMSGHPSHAPFLRIMRLRRNILKPIIERVLEEEKNGDRDILFWKQWEKKVKRACKLIKE